MSLLSKLTTQSDVQVTEDRLGGSYLLDTGIYEFTVKAAYLGESDGGAISLNVILEQGKTNLRQTFWMTSGKEKGQKNYYLDKDNVKHYLPGFDMANDLALLTSGEDISEQEVEDKVIKLYNAEQKGEVATTVQMCTGIVGSKISAAVFKQVVDKTAKNNMNKYVPTGETREENEIAKFFNPDDNRTVKEMMDGKDDPVFYGLWNDRYSGTTRNLAKGAAAGGKAGAPQAANRPTKLFNKSAA